ncbi:endonuclease III, partial [archaeon]
MDRVWEVVRRLMNYYEARWRPNEPDPFKVLIRTILSQNTSFKNEMEAFR